MQLVLAVDGEVAVDEREPEHMPAVRTVVAQEVQVVAGNLDAGAGVGEAETHDRSRGVVDRPLGLVGDDVSQRRVRRVLRMHAPQPEVAELAVDAHRDHRLVRRARGRRARRRARRSENGSRT